MAECVCPENIVMSRLKARKGDFSDADIEFTKKETSMRTRRRK